MLGVIKLHVKALVETRRKVLKRWISTACIGVTDKAHGDGWSRELAQVTTRARFMSWKTWRDSVIRRAIVAISARKGCMALADMKELRIVETWILKRGYYSVTTRSGKQNESNAEDCDQHAFRCSLRTHFTSLRFSGGRSAIK